MTKVQIYLEEDELEAVREAAARPGRSVREAIREAIQKTVLKPRRRAEQAGAQMIRVGIKLL